MIIYYLLLGYVKIFIPESARAEAATALLRRGISAKIDAGGNMLIPYLRRKRYFSALKKTEYETIGEGGLPVALQKLKRRPGIITAFVLLCALYVFSSLFVWDIRIEGNENVSDSVILKELSDVGFSVGAKWGAISNSDAENALLAASDTVGWININRLGSVAYVTVKEKTVYAPNDGEKAVCNVVATHDCIIEEITVKSGIAAVKAGDTVKAGDLLISGVLPSEVGGGFVAAEGSVLGRINSDISVEVPKREKKITFGEEKLYLAKIKIFKFNINIFKRYRKNDNTCAIIEDVKEYTLLGKYRIPITLERIYVAEKLETEQNYTDAELIKVASARLYALRTASLKSSELIRLRTFGEYTDSGYRITSAFTALTDIGEARAIEGISP